MTDNKDWTAWWKLRLPWENGPPWWRPRKRRRWQQCHTNIRHMECEMFGRMLGCDLPWDDWGY